MAKPTRCLEKNPTPQTVRFSGAWINLSEIAREVGLQPSHLSRIFKGQRTPSLRAARNIAAALGMTLDDLTMALGRIKPPKKQNVEKRFDNQTQAAIV